MFPDDGFPEPMLEDAAKQIDYSEHGPFRAAAYLTRLRTLVGAISREAAGASRYLAFTSDFGEAVRPVVPPAVVNASYGIAGAYIVGDVAYNGYRAQQHGENVKKVMAQASAFHLLASLLLPAAIIHTTVNQSKRLFRHMGRFAKYGPSLMGLACVPILPMAIDEPVEHAVAHLLDKHWPDNSGESEGSSPTTEEAGLKTE